MKKVLCSAVMVAGLMFVGCSTTTPQQQFAKPMLEKYDNLPSWVKEYGDIDTAVGSAMYMGQNYIQQQTEAIAVAKMNLTQKLSSKVDSMIKQYYQNKGIVKTNNSQVSVQVSSSLVKNVKVVDTYVADDGELFVKIEAYSTNLLEIIKNDDSESLFDELDRRVGNVKSN